MGLSLQLSMRQTQRLIMTPQMQQSIMLLQLNTVELEQLAQAELEENPFLQLDEDRGETNDGEVAPPESSESASAESASSPAGESAPSTESTPTGEADMFSAVESEVVHTNSLIDAAHASGEAPALENGATPPAEAAVPVEADAGPDSDVPASIEDDPAKFNEVDVNWEDFYEGAENRTYTAEPGREEYDFQDYTAAKTSLYDHLVWQLRLSALEGTAAEIGEYLLGCMDDSGYLDATSIEDAARKFEVELAEVERALAVVQDLEPVGVGARSTAECLLLQMKALGSYTETARIVLEEHFEALERKKFKDISRAIGVDVAEITDLFHKVSRLEPHPGRSHSKDPILYITPDVTVKLIDGELTIFVNEGRSGNLSVSRLYRRMLRAQEGALNKEEKAYALEKFRGALMLIKNIEKRKSTILRVTEAIMKVQREFLDKGVEALKPLTLREVADMVGMHESTIARVTSKKWVDTPQGTHLLKYFFSSAIRSSGAVGGSVSSRAIKDKLSGLIEEEDPKKPLSDQKIADILKVEGYNIARRTVAKYREQLKILPAKLRKQA